MASQPWENNMKVYTKNGVEIIRKADLLKLEEEVHKIKIVVPCIARRVL